MAVLAVAFTAYLGGCVEEAPPAEDPAPVAEAQQEFSSFGIERVIPLRIIQATYDCNVEPVIDPPYAAIPEAQPPVPWQGHCSPCTDGATNCGPDTVSFADIQTGVEQANFALRAVGVQIYVSKIEKLAMPTFYTTCNPPQDCTEIDWAAVQADLQKVYPYLNDTAGKKFAEVSWLSRAKQLAGDPTQIDVLVAHFSKGGEGRRAWEGPASLLCDTWLFERPQKLAHEIGHIIGLEHPMAPEQQTKVRDPEKTADLAVADLTEYWDLSYGRGPAPTYLPNTYFTSREQAQSFVAGGGILAPKAEWDTWHNCWVDGDCTLTCRIGWGLDEVTIGDPGIKGLGFTFVGDSPPWVFQRGFNAMLYMEDPPPPAVCDRWSTFSDSQAEQVKKILRSDIRLDAGGIGFDYSTHATSQRYALGHVRTINGFDQVDFDGDFERDIAVWEPPNTAGTLQGRFHARLSSTGYATTLSGDLGTSGDVPVPALYDSDSKTDFAVVRGGGLTGSDPYDTQLNWIWCSSAAGHSCGTAGAPDDGYARIQWGFRPDVPLPGLEFNPQPNTREVAYYRPSNGRVEWKSISTGQTGSIATNFHLTPNFTPLHGLYDSDDLTDLVIYDTVGARFYMLLSTLGWNVNNPIVRTVDPSQHPPLKPDGYYASDAGTNAPAWRLGGVALPAEKPGDAVPAVRRRVLRVWDASTGIWYTNWSPLTSATFQPCTFGRSRDVPLSSPVDSNLDGYTDMALYRPTGTYSPIVWVQRANANSCNLGSTTFSPGSARRLVVSAVRDMDALDGRGDLLVLDPDLSRWTRFQSQPNGSFSAQTPLVFGHIGSMGL